MVFIGADVNVTNEDNTRIWDWKTYKKSTTYAPVYSPSNQYALGYNPQLNIGSPNASIGGSGGVNPISSPSVVSAPSQAQTDAPVYTEAQQGGGGLAKSGEWTDLIIVGVIAIAAVLILPKLIKGLSSSSGKAGVIKAAL